MSGIFISYRREETAPYAGRLRDRLVQEFGQDQVFMDIDTIDPGVDFVKAIEEAVAAVDVLICVMGPDWSTITDASGARRLEDPTDFIRLEVASALKRDIRVVPVLVRGATMPSADQLPSDLKTLARRNALPLDDARFHVDMDRLIQSIPKGDAQRGVMRQAQNALDVIRRKAAAKKPPVPKTSRVVWLQIVAILAFFAVAGLLVGAGIVAATGNGNDLYPWFGAIPTWLAGIWLSYLVWQKHRSRKNL